MTGETAVRIDTSNDEEGETFGNCPISVLQLKGRKLKNMEQNPKLLGFPYEQNRSQRAYYLDNSYTMQGMVWAFLSPPHRVLCDRAWKNEQKDHCHPVADSRNIIRKPTSSLRCIHLCPLGTSYATQAHVGLISMVAQSTGLHKNQKSFPLAESGMET